MTVQQAAQGAVVNIASAFTTETVAVALPQVAEVATAGGLLISGFVNITVGTTAVSAQIKVRQGSTNAGTQVGVTDTVNGLVAGNSYSIPFSQIFYGAPPYGNQFCVTVTEPAATAAWSINDSAIFLDAVSGAG